MLYTYYLGLERGIYLGTRRGIENLELFPGVVCLEFCSIILAKLTNSHSQCLNVSVPTRILTVHGGDSIILLVLPTSYHNSQISMACRRVRSLLLNQSVQPWVDFVF